jgi:hypothetical protein
MAIQRLPRMMHIKLGIGMISIRPLNQSDTAQKLGVNQDERVHPGRGNMDDIPALGKISYLKHVLRVIDVKNIWSLAESLGQQKGDRRS